MVVGWILVMLGFMLALATMCISFILSVWGVFMMMPRHRCKDCGWTARAR